MAVHFSYPACDHPAGDVLFTWNGETLAAGPEAVVTNSADYSMSFEYKLILPGDEGGKHNHLIIKFTDTPGKGEGEPAPDESPVPTPAEEIRYKHYRWDGKGFVKAGEP